MSTAVAPPSPVATSTSASSASAEPTMADPLPVALALFAFALGIYAVRFIPAHISTLQAGSATVGLNYAVLVAGIAETLAGLFGIVRGVAYPSYVTATFGIWLIGFYLLVTQGAESKEFTPNALAWYVLALVVPVAILAVPAIVHRNIPFVIAFIALIVLLLTLGIGYHEVYSQVSAAAAGGHAPSLGGATNLLKVSGWAGLIAALAIWFAMAKEVYAATGVLKRT